MGASVTFQRIAGTGTLIPGEFNRIFRRFGAPSIKGSTLAFWGCEFTAQACVNSGQQGIYAVTDLGNPFASLTEVVDRNFVIPKGNGFTVRQFSKHTCIVGGKVIFLGQGNNAGGIYAKTAGLLNLNIDTVADYTTPQPGTSDVFGKNGLGNPVCGAQGVAFSSSDPFGVHGVYKTVGGGPLIAVADENTPIPGGPGNFLRRSGSQAFLNVSMDDDGSVSLLGTGSNFHGIYTDIGGSLSVVADPTTFPPGGNAPFESINNPSINDGAVAFVGKIGSSADIYLFNNNSLSAGIHQVTLGTELALDNGNIAVHVPNTKQLFIYDGSSTQKLIDTSDPLDGKAIRAFSMGHQALSGKKLAFRAFFWDGTDGVYVASLEGLFGGSPPPGGFVSPLITPTVCAEIDGIIGIGRNGRPGRGLQGPGISCVPNPTFVYPICDLPDPFPLGTAFPSDCVFSLMAVMVTGSDVNLSQTLLVADGPEPLSFDYFFTTTSGNLRVLLGGTEILNIPAPTTVANELTNATFLVDGEFLNESSLTLQFVLDGPTGSTILLDNVSYPGLVNGNFQTGDLSNWIATASGTGSVGTIGFIASPLTANAGPDQTVNELELVTLDGSGSIGSDTLNYTWTQLSGPNVSLDVLDPIHPTFVAPSIESNVILTFQLVVDDDGNNSEADTVDITVINTCDTTIDGNVNDNVPVGPGEVVCISGATVSGNVEIDAGEAVITNSTITGNVENESGKATVKESNVEGNVEGKCDGSGEVRVESSEVNGNIETESCEVVVITDNIVHGNIESIEDQSVTVTGNTVDGNIEIENPGSCTVGDNTSSSSTGCP